MSWYGHVMRMEHNALVRKIIEAGRTGRKSRERPRKSWLDPHSKKKERRKNMGEMNYWQQTERHGGLD